MRLQGLRDLVEGSCPGVDAVESVVDVLEHRVREAHGLAADRRGVTVQVADVAAAAADKRGDSTLVMSALGTVGCVGGTGGVGVGWSRSPPTQDARPPRIGRSSAPRWWAAC